jgi:hypothetical protein
MEDEITAEITHLRWRDQTFVRRGDAVQRAVEMRAPVLQKAAEFREVGRIIVILPDEGLDQFRKVGKPLQGFGCGQAVSVELLQQVALGHCFLNVPNNSLWSGQPRITRVAGGGN